MLDVVVTGGLAVLPAGAQEADIGIDGEKIAAIGAPGSLAALGGLAMERGNDLLRVKGIVAFADRPEKPAVVQAAQHAMFAPEWLDAWPDADHRSRLVFIVHDIAPEEILGRFAFASPILLQQRVPGEGRDPSVHVHAS